MKNQLFRISPDLKITQKLLNIFGINDLEDNHSFTKINLKDLNTVNNLNEMNEELSRYYIPCKAKQYLQNIDEKRAVTILRQFLKVHNHTLMSKEKYTKGNKVLFYQVIPVQIDMNTKRNLEKVVISFD
jgi:hypothetical protein